MINQPDVIENEGIRCRMKQALSESKTIACKYCGKNEVIKFGKYKGDQRYFCMSCRRKFKDDDHVFRMSVPVAYIEYALNSYYGGMRINDIRHNLQVNFGYQPSKTLIRLWVDKYTTDADKMVQDLRPKTGNTWVLNELMMALGRRRIWIYEIIDDRTNYILASQIFLSTRVDIKPLIRRACEITGIMPRLILVYMPPSRYSVMKKEVGYALQHVPKEAYADRHRIGISGNPNLYDTNIYRIKSPDWLRTVKTADRFFTGLCIHHNYFAPNENIGSRTPAAAANISYPYHSWKELVEQKTG